MTELKKYKTIKWVLKQQIEKATKTLWTQLLKEIEDDKI